MDLSVLMEFAARHHGLFRYEDAVMAHVTRNALDRLRDQGVVRLVGNGVYAVVGAPDTWRRQLLAATWRAGSMAWASHRSAAALWGLSPGRGVEVLVPMGTGARPFGVHVHKSRSLTGPDVDQRDGIPVTSIERTIIDLAAVVPMGRLARSLDHAVECELTNAERILRRLRVMPTKGRTGVSVLRILLAERTDLDPGDFNPFERMTAGLLRRSDLPEPVRQHRLDLHGSRYYLDFAFPEFKVAIECDGMLGHRSATSQAYDLARQNAILADGWKLRRFAWSAVRLQPGETLMTIRQALLDSGWKPRVPSSPVHSVF